MEAGKTFRSKIGLEVLLPLTAILGVATALLIREGEWGNLWIMGLVLLFVGSFYLRTYYQITPDGELKVVCGFFTYQPIAIGAIKRISKTHNPLSSPALSLDRLEIRYNTNNILLVSPSDKQGFVVFLQRFNPSIEAKL